MPRTDALVEVGCPWYERICRLDSSGRWGIRAALWSRVNEFFLEVSGCAHREEFCARVYDSIRRLIPYDVGVALFEPGSIRYLHGTGLPESVNDRYNRYYHRLHPWRSGPELARLSRTWRVDWKNYENSEYVTDFAFPNRIRFSLCPVTQRAAPIFTLHRSRGMGPFSDVEREILAVVNPHISRLFAIHGELALARDRGLPSAQEIARCFPRLSPRESEVLAGSMDGSPAAEIGRRLGIGERTVETHLQNIYTKLDVRTRREAADRARERVRGSRHGAG